MLTIEGIAAMEECLDKQPGIFTQADQNKVSQLFRQVGGDHYKKMGDYQPWAVLRHWLSPEEFRGYMKGSVIAYLAREQDKGGDVDVSKAAHTLDALDEYLQEQRDGN